MKKILFSAYSLDIGGIETALLALLNYLSSQNKYDITLVLEKKQGIFMEELNNNIKVMEYTPNNNKNIFIRKMLNLLKRFLFVIKYKNKFNFSVSFATYSLMCSFVARTASNNNILWVHTNYLDLYKNDIEKFREFFYNVKYDKFRHLMFVSIKAKSDFLNIFPQMKEKAIFCNNMIDYKKIQEKAKESIDIEKQENCVTFLNVGRHSEEEKKLTRIIYACDKLKKHGFNFKVIFVGEGKDTNMYQDLVEQLSLNDFCIFVGEKKNPYPYFNISDVVILTSDYEGYPVVFLESFILKKPMITTDVSDALEDVEGKFGIVTKKEVEDIYIKMRDFITKGYKIEKEFDIKRYNEEIMEKIESLINE